MLLHSPVCITPRLLAGVQVGDGWVSIEYSKREGDGGRTRYKWYIDTPSGEYSGDDLQSGCQGGTLQRGLSDLLCFLSACGEGYAYEQTDHRESENASLFPPKVAEWAYANNDEISSLLCELDEGEDLIEE